MINLQLVDYQRSDSATVPFSLIKIACEQPLVKKRSRSILFDPYPNSVPVQSISEAIQKRYTLELANDFHWDSDYELFAFYLSQEKHNIHKIDASKVSYKHISRLFEFLNSTKLILKRVQEIDFGVRSLTQRDFILCCRFILTHFSGLYERCYLQFTQDLCKNKLEKIAPAFPEGQ